MKKVMFTVEEVAQLIKNKHNLLIAGDENLLKKLPAGNWIGGSIPYFMGENGGITTKEKLFINELPEFVEKVEIKEYNEQNINQVYKESPQNGFSVIIIPASSKVHLSFALNAPGFKNFASKPLIGWISGVLLSDLGKLLPKSVLGNNLKITDTSAAVMHVTLPPTHYAEISIVNIFDQKDGAVISFMEDGFSATNAYVNGKMVNFAEYVTNNNIDTRLPIIADYYGAMINISFQNVNNEAKTVDFYAPVFKGVQYKFASPIKNYVDLFTSQIKDLNTKEIIFSCNCILNYLHSELEGKKTAEITGPITFGEIAYQLLNQTMTYLKVSKY